MNDTLLNRLNKGLKAITDPAFLTGEGLGNETPFHIFDYPAENEIEVRNFIQNKLIPKIGKNHTEIKLLHINLFELVIEYLKSEGYYNGVLELQESGDEEALMEAFEGVLHSETIAELIVEKQKDQDSNLIFISGVGGLWNMIRLQSLLSNLQSKLGMVPLVLFFPGTYTDTGLNMFDEFEEDRYYRAFKLVP
ncbi:MAG: DUF1788 domain-containing protein [Deltaproteobacteria bacterium]|nr:DUF1788 domain-containing protein [Deltaproteobacteria bacterium]